MIERHYAIGLYGLKLEKKIDAMPWLFNDATLECADINLFQQYSANDQERAVIEVAFGARQWSDVDLTKIPFGDQFQRVAPPDSFILIKRKQNAKVNDSEMSLDVQKRARELSSLLCICRSFGSWDVSGYMDFTYLHESPLIGVKVIPYFEPSTNKFKSTLEPSIPSWIRKPDVISYEQLRNAVIDGTPIKTTSGKAWSIHKEIPFVRIMLKQKRTPSEQRLVRASVVAYHAHHASSPELRLAQAVTSMEMLFPGNTEFKQLIQRLSQLNIFDDGSRDKINDIMTCRHLYVHDGQLVPEGAAKLALGISATIMHCYAEGLEKYDNKDALIKRLDLLEKARELMVCGEAEKKVISNIFPPISTNTKDLLLQLRKSDQIPPQGTQKE